MIRFCCALLVACSLLTSCGDDEGFTSAPIPSARLTVVNAIPDSPGLRVVTNNISGGTIAFGQATPITNVLPQIPLDFRVSFLATNIDQTVVEQELNLDIGFSQTVLLTGTFAAPVVNNIIDPPFDFADGTTDTRIRFLNATSNIASATVNLINPNGTDQSISITNGQPTGFTTTTAGANVQIEVTDTSTNAVLWRSGEFTLSAAATRTIVLIDYFGPGPETVRMVSVNDPSLTQLFLEEPLNAGIRFANHAADKGPLDFYVDDVLTTTLAFNEVSDFFTLTAAEVAITITPSGDSTTEFSNQTRTLFPGFFHTLQIAANADGTTVGTNLYGEQRQPIANLATVNITKLAPGIANLDVYFQNRGEGVNGTPEGTRLADFSSGSITLFPQDYDLYVTEPGSTNVLVGPVPITLESRGIYTVHIVDGVGGGLPLTVQLLDDFQN